MPAIQPQPFDSVWNSLGHKNDLLQVHTLTVINLKISRARRPRSLSYLTWEAPVEKSRVRAADDFHSCKPQVLDFWLYEHRSLSVVWGVWALDAFFASRLARTNLRCRVCYWITRHFENTGIQGPSLVLGGYRLPGFLCFSEAAKTCTATRNHSVTHSWQQPNSTLIQFLDFSCAGGTQG